MPFALAKQNGNNFSAVEKDDSRPMGMAKKKMPNPKKIEKESSLPQRIEKQPNSLNTNLKHLQQ